MAEPGRPRVDDKTKENRGTARKDRKPIGVPSFENETKPRRPSRLKGEAAKFWYAHIDMLWERGWIGRMSVCSFAILCWIYEDLRKLEDDITANGMFCMVPTSTGAKWAERPETKYLTQLRKDFLKWSEAFGLTPVSSKKFANAKPRSDTRRDKLSLMDFSKGLEKSKSKGGA